MLGITRRMKQKRNIRYPFLAKVEQMIDMDRYDDAEPILKKYIRNKTLPDPVRSLVLQLYARVCYLKGQTAAAQRYYESAIKLNALNYEAIFQLSLLYAMEYDVENSLKYIRRCLSYDPQNPEYLKHFAWCLSVDGDVNDAIAIYSSLVQQELMDAESFVDFSMTYVLSKNFETAKKTLYQGLEKYPENYILEDSLVMVDELKLEYHTNRKELYKEYIPKLKFNPKVFGFALLKVIDEMSVRSYMRVEVQQACRMLYEMNKAELGVRDPAVLAAVCELVVASTSASYKDMLKRVTRYYQTSIYSVRSWYRTVMDDMSEVVSAIRDDLEQFYGENLDIFEEEDTFEDD